MKPPLPFARTFPPTCTPHRYEEGRDWNGISYCVRCGGMEGSLLEFCPVQRLTVEEINLAYDAFRFGDRVIGGAIQDYNARAKRYNDELLDSTMRNVSMTGQHSK